jgi:hypothetical protein
MMRGVWFVFVGFGACLLALWGQVLWIDYFDLPIAFSSAWIARGIIITAASLFILLVFAGLQKHSLLIWAGVFIIMALNPALYWSLTTPHYDFSLPVLLLIALILLRQKRAVPLHAILIGLSLGLMVMLVPGSLLLAILPIAYSLARSGNWSPSDRLAAVAMMLLPAAMVFVSFFLIRSMGLQDLPLPAFSTGFYLWPQTGLLFSGLSVVFIAGLALRQQWTRD